jgi:hypothetical protein
MGKLLAHFIKLLRKILICSSQVIGLVLRKSMHGQVLLKLSLKLYYSGSILGITLKVIVQNDRLLLRFILN